MKKIITITILALVVALPAFAQFRPAINYSKDLLNGSPLTLVTLGVTNIVVPAYIGKDGFSVTPYFVGTNAGTANLQINACPMADGVHTNSVTVTPIGAVAMAATVPVRKSIFVADTIFPGCGLVMIQLTNAHTDSITVSNLYVGSW